MNVNVGKFFKKLFGRKQSAPTKIERRVKVSTETKNKFQEKDHTGHSTKGIDKHNAYQAMRAKKRKRNRVKTKMQKQNRIANRKGGKS